MKAYYKEPFDLELNDDGIYLGKQYKLLKIETNLMDRYVLVLLNLHNDKETIHNVPASEFAVKVKAEHSLTLDDFVLLYKKAKELRYI